MTNIKPEIGLVRHEDHVQPFTLEDAPIRGRMVRCGHVIDTIISRHKYHPLVSKLLGEMLTMAAMLSSNMPENGILTMQIKGSEPVSFVVVDVTHDGGIRGYVNMAEGGNEKLEALSNATDESKLNQILGEGYLAITLDMGDGSPYHGIVPLEGDSVSDAVTLYFTQSKQVEVMFKISVGQREREDGTQRWRSGGIMIESIPEEKPDDLYVDERAEKWDYHSLLLETLTEDELLDPHLAPSALLYRLFNEGGVRIEEQLLLSRGCRCTREKVKSMLLSMDEESLEDMKIDGEISVICQFCKKEEIFTEGDLL